MNSDKLSTVRNIASENAMAVFDEAWSKSEQLLSQARPIVEESLSKASLDPSQICIATVGSTARHEALSASDIDLLPIWCGDPKEFPRFEDLTGKVREDLRQQTGLDVSTSRNLMRSTELASLCRADGIGGDDDHRRTLTQRMLVLTESEQLGGSRSISEVRREILEAYVGEREDDRTVSKHPMAVCNDIARYYRTLCVDYKSRAETKPESWAERHAKLRNPRKIWYFSTVMAISHRVAEMENVTSTKLFDGLADIFGQSPILRLASAAEASNLPHVKDIYEIFSNYLSDMGSSDFRAGLSRVSFEDRKDPYLPGGASNPYFNMYQRSRDLSAKMILTLEEASQAIQKKALNWFLL